jgi:mRNA-degrading endonuclease HigB of HigAB toxin-antitoxin module
VFAKKLSTEISKIKKTFCYTKVNRSEWSQPDKLKKIIPMPAKKKAKKVVKKAAKKKARA